MKRDAPKANVTLVRILESERVTAYVLLIPTLVGLLFFTLGPVVAAFGVSLTRWDLTSPPEWVGLANYQAMVALDPLSRISFLNTLYYVVGTVPIGVALSLLFAVAMNPSAGSTANGISSNGTHSASQPTPYASDLTVTARFTGQSVTLSAGVKTGQGFGFTLVGEPLSVYQILTSSNLVSWQTVSTITNSSGQMQFSDPTVGNRPASYYRALLAQ